MERSRADPLRVVPADGASRAAALPLRARAGGREPSLALVLHRAAPVPLSAVAQQLPAVVVAAGRGEDAREIASLRAMVPPPSETPLAPASIPGTMSLIRAGTRADNMCDCHHAGARTALKHRAQGVVDDYCPSAVVTSVDPRLRSLCRAGQVEGGGGLLRGHG